MNGSQTNYRRSSQAGDAAGSQFCPWCGRVFVPRRTGGRGQRFCSPACRRAFDAAARAKGRAEIASEGAPAPGIATQAGPTRAFARAGEAASSAGGGGSPSGPARPDTPARFVVEVPLHTIEGLVRIGFLRSDQQGDLGAIISALKRIGQAPTISRIV